LDVVELPPQFAEVTALGPVEGIYRLSPPTLKGKFTAWFIATILCGVILAVGYFGEATLKQHGMEMVAVGALMLGAFGLITVGGVWLLVLLGMWLLNAVLFANPQVVAVYRDGVANWEKGKLLVWPWSDIREIYTYIFADKATSDTGLGARFDIVHRDRSRFSVSHLVIGWNELMDRLRGEVDSRVGGEINRALDAGQPVPFGKDLVVEREGVKVGKKLTPWDTLREYRMERGMLVLKAQKTSISTPIASIPNLDLLLAILKGRLRSLPETA
jgi:hypothetical protein